MRATLQRFVHSLHCCCLLIFLCDASYTIAQDIDFYANVQPHRIKFADSIGQELASGKLGSAQGAYYYSYIGEYYKSINTYDVPVRWTFDTLDATMIDRLKGLHPVDAVAYISKAALTKQFVILNEAHHKPQHRLFARSLLDSLYAQGYRYFGVECLNPHFLDSTQYLLDTRLNERGYPLNASLSGTYIREPQMSNLIRAALAKGFTIFAYERYQSGIDRELAQALNIKRVFDRHPQGKFFIYCGWDHAIESVGREDQGKEKFMAAYIHELCGIDPLCIDQDLLSERQAVKESPFRSLLTIDSPSVWLDDDGNVFKGPKGFDKFDILISHPTSKIENGRPDFLAKQKGWQTYSITKDQIRIPLPVLISATRNGEDYLAAPLDRIEFGIENNSKVLYLPGGDFLLSIENAKGDFQQMFIEISERTN